MGPIWSTTTIRSATISGNNNNIWITDAEKLNISAIFDLYMGRAFEKIHRTMIAHNLLITINIVLIIILFACLITFLCGSLFKRCWHGHPSPANAENNGLWVAFQLSTSLIECLPENISVAAKMYAYVNTDGSFKPRHSMWSLTKIRIAAVFCKSMETVILSLWKFKFVLLLSSNNKQIDPWDFGVPMRIGQCDYAIEIRGCCTVNHALWRFFPSDNKKNLLSLLVRLYKRHRSISRCSFNKVVSEFRTSIILISLSTYTMSFKIGSSDVINQQNIEQQSSNNRMIFGDSAIAKPSATVVHKVFDTAGRLMESGGDLLTAPAVWLKEMQKNRFGYMVVLAIIVGGIAFLYCVFRFKIRRNGFVLPPNRSVELTTVMSDENIPSKPPLSSIASHFSKVAQTSNMDMWLWTRIEDQSI